MENTEKATILVVDDTPENIDVLVGILRDNYKVRAALNADQAFKAISKKVPDMVLLDIMMPDVDGYEVCRQLKATPETRDLPVIFLTAKTAIEDEIKGLALGAVDYITKPISPPVVLARVSTHLALKSARENLESRNNQLKNTLTDLKSAQDQLVLSEKMAALGQLVAGVAHEINTPLGAIKSSVETAAASFQHTIDTLNREENALDATDLKLLWDLLGQVSGSSPLLSPREKRQKVKELLGGLESKGISMGQTEAKQLTDLGMGHDTASLSVLLDNKHATELIALASQFNNVRKGLQTISTASDKASKIVFSLKSYSHFSHSESKLVSDIRDGLQTVLTLYQNQIKQGVELVTEFDDIPKILCYADELDQVWTNLVHNSLQAMSNQGRLTVRVRKQEDNIVVDVADNGPGIPEEIQGKIFDPFFTTKPPGEGSGLGLDIVMRIVEKHGGKMTFQTQAGEGTTFTVTLPIETPPTENGSPA